MEDIIPQATGQTTRLCVPPVRRCLLVYLAYCIFPQTEVMGQAYLVTPKCETTLGSPITLFGNYSSSPGIPVSWTRPDGSIIIECEPTKNCVTQSLSYSGSQSSSGLEYTLTILESAAVDYGRWTLEDGNLVLPITVTKAVDLTKVNFTCSSGRQTGDNFRIEQASSDNLTCCTECSSNDIAITCYLEQDGNTTPFLSSASSSCGIGLEKSSSTMVFSENPSLSGNFSLCCNLIAGDCSYNQENCKNLTVLETSTSTTGTLENTTGILPVTGCCDADDGSVSVPRDGSIAVLVLASILLVACVGLIVTLLQAKQSGKWLVVVTLIACACDLTAIVLIAVSLSNGVSEVNTSEGGVHVPGMRTAGVVLFVVALLGFILAAGFHLKNRCGTGQNRTENGQNRGGTGKKGSEDFNLDAPKK